MGNLLSSGNLVMVGGFFGWLVFFLSFPYLHTNLQCVLLFLSLVAGWIKKYEF